MRPMAPNASLNVRVFSLFYYVGRDAASEEDIGRGLYLKCEVARLGTVDRDEELERLTQTPQVPSSAARVMSEEESSLCRSWSRSHGGESPPRYRAGSCRC